MARPNRPSAPRPFFASITHLVIGTPPPARRLPPDSRARPRRQAKNAHLIAFHYVIYYAWLMPPDRAGSHESAREASSWHHHDGRPARDRRRLLDELRLCALAA